MAFYNPGYRQTVACAVWVMSRSPLNPSTHSGLSLSNTPTPQYMHMHKQPRHTHTYAYTHWCYPLTNTPVYCTDKSLCLLLLMQKSEGQKRTNSPFCPRLLWVCCGERDRGRGREREKKEGKKCFNSTKNFLGENKTPTHRWLSSFLPPVTPQVHALILGWWI